MDSFLNVMLILVIIIYAGLIPLAFIIAEDRRAYTKSLYIGVETLLKKYQDRDIVEILSQLQRFYENYIQFNPGVKRYYPSFIYWINYVMLQINLNRKITKKISPYQDILNKVIEKYESENPFNKCTDYQQNLLRDLKEIINDNNEIMLLNIIHRTEEEFIRLSTETKKNDKLNRVSIGIGVLGIVVSIGIAIIKF